MAKDKITDLREHMFMQLERLNDDEITPEQMEIEKERSKCIVGIASQLIQSAKVEVDFVKAYGGDPSSFFGEQKRLG